MDTIGTVLLGIALVAAGSATLCYALVVAGHVRWLQWGRFAVWQALIWAAAAAGLLLTLFVLQRYDVRYVYDYSSADLELRFRIAAVWAGQPGSLLVWALIGLGCAPVLIRRTREFEPYALALLMLLQAAILSFLLARNPFAPTILNGVASFPADGRGLNPVLHNVWMVIHPPTLFTGYGLLGVPFCLALAGLWRRDYDRWVTLALPWAIAGWAVLGLALTMGGYWAYESLGWGGYWGWDPVENSSLVPWLMATALLHGLLVQRTRGALRRTNFGLAILCYGFVFYASFLTRSGVLSQFSVHSFIADGLKDVMIGVLVGLLSLALALLALRWRDIPRKPLSEALLSRDTTLTLGAVAFVVLGLVVAFGTSIPWITSLRGLSAGLERTLGAVFPLDDGSQFGQQPLGDGRFALTPAFFQRTTPPLALVVATLMAVGPLLGWQHTSRQTLSRALRWPYLIAIGTTGAGIALGVRSPLSVVTLLVAGFALGTNGLMIVRTVRAGWLKLGGYLAHVGMALLLVGVVGSYAYTTPETKLVIPAGQMQSAYGHSFAFWGYQGQANNRHTLRLQVDQASAAPFVAAPELYYNDRMGAWVRTPAIRRSLWQDLYISPEEYVPADDPNTVVLAPGEQGVIGPYTVGFSRFAIDTAAMQTGADSTTVGATVTITHEGSVQTLTPLVTLGADQVLAPTPIGLGDGRALVLDNVSASAQLAQLRISGLNLPLTPAMAVFTVSVKPAIGLVWLGALLMFLGGCLAAARRRWEHAPGSVVRRPAQRWGLPGGGRLRRGWPANALGDDPSSG